MPWGRCDDSFYDHPKVRALAPGKRLAAVGLYWRAISFCNRHLNDGKLTHDDVQFLDGTVSLVHELVRVGLWEDGENGPRIHDYLKFNKSRRTVLRERKERAEAGRLGGLASGETRRQRREANPKQKGSKVLQLRFKQNEANQVEPPSRPVPSRPSPSMKAPIAAGSFDPEHETLEEYHARVARVMEQRILGKDAG